MFASNSAAHVSTRLNTAWRFCACRWPETSASERWVSRPMRLSEKPSRFQRTRLGTGALAPAWTLCAISRSASTSAAIPRMNQGSIDDSELISLTEIPARSASATQKMRRGRATFTSDRIRSRSAGDHSASRMPSRFKGESRPSVPFSSDRSAFCSAMAKVRPIDITSPTDFIEVVSVWSACGNFSKLKRGIFTTQ